MRAAVGLLLAAQVGVVLALCGLASAMHILEARVYRAESAAAFCGCPVPD